MSTLSGFTLPLLPSIEVAPAAWTALLAMTLLSAALTLFAYILNNFGIRYIAPVNALISASAPALTALFARISLKEALPITNPDTGHWLGHRWHGCIECEGESVIARLAQLLSGLREMFIFRLSLS